MTNPISTFTALPAHADLRLVASPSAIPVFTETRWRRPVTIQMQSGLERLFWVTEEALDFLENEWPIRRGIHLARAIEDCRDAIDGKVASEVARDAFIAAAGEAGLIRVGEIAA